MYIVFFNIIFIFFLKNHFVKNLNQHFYKELELTKEINKHYDLIQRILIPVELSHIRMNTGLPIFIDWKHHAFKYDELIEWNKRVTLAQKFFETNDFDKRAIILNDINQIEEISHILIDKKKLNKDCKNLIDHETFVLISANKCYM